jgi:S-adenosylmethionine:tRNA ribosyltransferase-isomerase
VDTADLDYDLPPDRIAQAPVEPRDAARLLVDPGRGARVVHHTVADLPALLAPGDVLVVNDTRVRAARLHLRKPTGGTVEVLVLGPGEALVRPGRRVPPGTVLQDGAGLAVRVGADLGDGRREIEVLRGDPDAVGEVPLPPYIHERLADPERYQTVYARRPGSVAAPTAGLHLTPAVLDACRTAGVSVVTVELSVGLDTFRPIATERVEDHPIHSEEFEVEPEAWAQIQAARAAGGRVVAVGTTVFRTLESVAHRGALSGRTDLFIRPGFEFAVVDRLLTNFHVPRTTLLALVDTFTAGRWRALYAEALAEGYRFLSFGDAMLLTRAGSC